MLICFQCDEPAPVLLSDFWRKLEKVRFMMFQMKEVLKWKVGPESLCVVCCACLWMSWMKNHYLRHSVWDVSVIWPPPSFVCIVFYLSRSGSVLLQPYYYPHPPTSHQIFLFWISLPPPKLIWSLPSSPQWCLTGIAEQGFWELGEMEWRRVGWHLNFIL